MQVYYVFLLLNIDKLTTKQKGTLINLLKNLVCRHKTKFCLKAVKMKGKCYSRMNLCVFIKNEGFRQNDKRKFFPQGNGILSVQKTCLTRFAIWQIVQNIYTKFVLHFLSIKEGSHNILLVTSDISRTLLIHCH